MGFMQGYKYALEHFSIFTIIKIHYNNNNLVFFLQFPEKSE